MSPGSKIYSLLKLHSFYTFEPEFEHHWWLGTQCLPETTLLAPYSFMFINNNLCYVSCVTLCLVTVRWCNSHNHPRRGVSIIFSCHSTEEEIKSEGGTGRRAGKQPDRLSDSRTACPSPLHCILRTAWPIEFCHRANVALKVELYSRL